MTLRHVRKLYTAWLALRYRRRGMTTAINNELFRIAPAARSVAPWSPDRRTRVYEPDVWAYLLELIRPDDIIVDVGANVGVYAIACARRLDAGRVLAFEPDPRNASLLRRHAHWNDVADRITVIEAAAGNTNGRVSFSALGSPQSSVRDIWGSGRGKRSVSAVTLDEAVPRSDILKIDVEGYEGQVIAGADELLTNPSRRPRVILLEVHPDLLPAAGWDEGRLRERLEQHQYSVDELASQHAQEHWVLRDRLTE